MSKEVAQQKEFAQKQSENQAFINILDAVTPKNSNGIYRNQMIQETAHNYFWRDRIEQQKLTKEKGIK